MVIYRRGALEASASAARRKGVVRIVRQAALACLQPGLNDIHAIELRCYFGIPFVTDCEGKSDGLERMMASYKEIQEYVRANNGFVPKSCWIAHVLSDLELTKRVSHRRRDGAPRLYPCPDAKRPAILAALKHFTMVVA